MAQSNPAIVRTFKAAADLSANRFHLVKFTANDNEVDLAGANAQCPGILQNDPNAAGKSAAVCLGGTSKLVVDGSGTPIVPGDWLEADASGHGVKSTVAGHECIARALYNSTAAGDIIEVEVVKCRF